MQACTKINKAYKDEESHNLWPANIEQSHFSACGASHSDPVTEDLIDLELINDARNYLDGLYLSHSEPSTCYAISVNNSPVH